MGWLLQEKCLDNELIYVSAGGKAVAAIVAGEASARLVAGQALVLARLAGADVVSIVSHTPTLVMSVMAQKGISDGSQLRGKAIGVTRIGAASHLGLIFALKHFGLSEKDVRVIQIGGIPEFLAALQGSRLAAGVITPPNNFLAVKLGFRELLDISSLNIPVDQGTVMKTGRFAKEKPEQVRAIVKAYVEGIHRAKTDKALTLGVLKIYKTLRYANAWVDVRFIRRAQPGTNSLSDERGNKNHIGRRSPYGTKSQRGKSGGIYRSTMGARVGQGRLCRKSV